MKFSEAKKVMSQDVGATKVTSMVLVPPQRDDPRFTEQTHNLEAGFCPMCGLGVTVEFDAKLRKYFYECENLYHFWVRDPVDLAEDIQPS